MSLIVQQINTANARRDAAQAAEKQAKDIERARVAAEISARSAETLAETTQRALEIQGRGTTAAEESARAASSLAQDQRIIRKIIASSQSARLMVTLEPIDAKSKVNFRKLYLVNASSVMARRIEVGYAVHTIGVSDQEKLVWELAPNKSEPVSESLGFYLKQIETLKPRYSKPFLAADSGEVIPEELPAPKWFVIRMTKSELEKAFDGTTYKKVPSEWPGLRPAVVFGYIRYADNANQSKKLPFCMSLDAKKPDPNCEKVNTLE